MKFFSNILWYFITPFFTSTFLILLYILYVNPNDFILHFFQLHLKYVITFPFIFFAFLSLLFKNKITLEIVFLLLFAIVSLVFVFFGVKVDDSFVKIYKSTGYSTLLIVFICILNKDCKDSTVSILSGQAMFLIFVFLSVFSIYNLYITLLFTVFFAGINLVHYYVYNFDALQSIKEFLIGAGVVFLVSVLVLNI